MQGDESLNVQPSSPLPRRIGNFTANVVRITHEPLNISSPAAVLQSTSASGPLLSRVGGVEVVKRVVERFYNR